QSSDFQGIFCVAKNSRQNTASPTPLPPPPAETGGGVLLAAIWLVGYLVAFLSMSASDAFNSARGEVLLVALLRPDDLVANWFAGASWASLGQRLWIAFIVLGALSAATSAGWLCLRLLRVDLAVTRLEMTLLAVAVGMNVVSLATL